MWRPRFYRKIRPDGAPAGAAEGRLKTVERSAIVPYTAAQMYGLVNDVERYPEFLPWCVGASSEAQGEHETRASVRVAKGVLQTQFTTCNSLKPDREIVMSLIDGPFRSLTGEWRFEPIGARGSRVSFRVAFEFKSALAGVAFNPVFESLCGTIVDAFAARARNIYA